MTSTSEELAGHDAVRLSAGAAVRVTPNEGPRAGVHAGAAADSRSVLGDAERRRDLELSTGAGALEAAGLVARRAVRDSARSQQQQESNAHAGDLTSTTRLVPAAAAAAGRAVAAAARGLSRAPPAEPPATERAAHSVLELQHPLYVSSLLERGRAALRASRAAHPPTHAAPAAATQPAVAEAAEPVRPLPAARARPPAGMHAPADHLQLVVDGSSTSPLAFRASAGATVDLTT